MQLLDCLHCARPVLDEDRAYRYSVTEPDGTQSPTAAVHQECEDAQEGSKGQRVRVTCDGPAFHHASVKIIQPDGTEIPISTIVSAVTVRINANRFNTAIVTFDNVEIQAVGCTTNPVYVVADANPDH